MATRNKIELLGIHSDVREWFERYEFHVLANNVEVIVAETASEEEKRLADKKNLASFISKCDGDMYKLIKSLCSPHEVETVKYQEVRTLIVEHLAPKPTKYAMRYKFHKIVQKSEQSASDFILELCKIGADCAFDNFDDALLDRLLVGLKDEKLVSELLVKTDLTLDVAIRETLAREQAQKEAQMMHKDTVHKVNWTPKNSKNSNFKLKNKGGNKSKKSEAENKNNLKCNKCSTIGHKALECGTKCFTCGKCIISVISVLKRKNNLGRDILNKDHVIMLGEMNV